MRSLCMKKVSRTPGEKMPRQLGPMKGKCPSRAMAVMRACRSGLPLSAKPPRDHYRPSDTVFYAFRQGLRNEFRPDNNNGQVNLFGHSADPRINRFPVKEPACCIDREGLHPRIHLVFVIDSICGMIIVLEGDPNNRNTFWF